MASALGEATRMEHDAEPLGSVIRCAETRYWHDLHCLDDVQFARLDHFTASRAYGQGSIRH